MTDVAANPTDSLTVRDNRTGQEYDIPITDGTIKAADLGQIQHRRGHAGLATYDPGFVNTASCRSAVTYIDGEKGILEYRGYPIEQLAEKSLVPRGRLPADPRRAAHQGRVRRVGARDHLPHVRPREREVLHGGLPLRRPPDGHADGLGRRPVDVLPRRPQHQRRRQPAHPDRADDREDADAGRLVLPARAGQAVRLPRQRPRLHRQLPLDAVQDERAEVRGRPAPGQGPRRALHPARRPRAELLDQRGALGRLLAGRPLLGGRPPASARSTARCTVAPTRRCCGCCGGSARRRTSPRSSRA